MSEKWEVGSIWRLLSWRELGYFMGHLHMGHRRSWENSGKAYLLKIQGQSKRSKGIKVIII